MSTAAASLLAATILSLVHFFSPSMRFLDGIPRSRWLSIGGGVSVAYVFVHVLPELATAADEFAEHRETSALVVEQVVYLIALAGLMIFYGLDKLAIASRGRQRRAEGQDEAAAGVFWLHIGSFALYNLIIGYLLLHREENTLASLALFAVAMALHFLVTDQNLNEHHRVLYRRYGRYFLIAALIGGWIIGMVTPLPPLALNGLFAFLAGGVVLNVLKEELPRERESRYWVFVIGVGVYSLLLLVV